MLQSAAEKVSKGEEDDHAKHVLLLELLLKLATTSPVGLLAVQQGLPMSLACLACIMMRVLNCIEKKW